MGDLHADRGARRARGVLQVGNIVDVDVGWGEHIPRRVGYLIDDDDLRPSEVRELEQKRPNGFGRRRCRQTAVGCASRSAVSRRSAWPGNSGANSGTAMVPALIAAKNPAT